MQITTKKTILSVLLASTLLLSACDSKNTESAQDTKFEEKTIQMLSSDPIKDFAKTPNDQHDIELLLNYDTSYTEISDAMEDELNALNKQGNLTPEFAYNRKKDNLVSASELLKSLDLKTEQGRYIQGLIANYWDQQLQLLEQNKDKKLDDPSLAQDRLKGLNDYLHAQDQLEHWAAQYPQIERQESK